jgi:hypothetical protein
MIALQKRLRSYYDETEINSKPVYMGELNDKFYDLFVDNKGNLIDGTDIRPFLDWTPLTPDRPRWARVSYKPLPLTSNQYPRGYVMKLETYLDSEIHPVDERCWEGMAVHQTNWKAIDHAKFVGESLQYNFHRSFESDVFPNRA